MNPLPLQSLSSLLSLALLSVMVAGAACAQEQEQEPDQRNRVVVVENVRYDYAQVLNVEPVFQVLRATRTEEHCEPVSTRTLDPVHVVVDDEEKGRLGRLWTSVRRIFGAEEEAMAADAVGNEEEVVRRDALLTRNCKVVEVGREFRRPIAYDVDYVYRGTKYRSRLPDDPGNRLRIRVSVTPHLSGAELPSSSAH
jgi:uncharacterized protein YcfJ